MVDFDGLVTVLAVILPKRSQSQSNASGPLTLAWQCLVMTYVNRDIFTLTVGVVP